MLLDVRLPIGALFAVLGLLVGGYGVWTGVSTRVGLIDAVWGLVMITFGAPMAYYGWRETGRVRAASRRQ